MSLKQGAQFLRDDLLKPIAADITGQVFLVSMNQPTFLRLHEDRFVVGNLYLDPAKRAWMPWKLDLYCECFPAVRVRLTFQMASNSYDEWSVG